ncbi:unnamed protein product [Caenorhabditis nigoni]
MRVPLLVEREDCNDPFTTIGMLLLEELASAFGFVHVASAFGSLISESNDWRVLSDGAAAIAVDRSAGGESIGRDDRSAGDASVVDAAPVLGFVRS